MTHAYEVHFMRRARRRDGQWHAWEIPIAGSCLTRPLGFLAQTKSRPALRFNVDQYDHAVAATVRFYRDRVQSIGLSGRVNVLPVLVNTPSP